MKRYERAKETRHKNAREFRDTEDDVGMHTAARYITSVNTAEQLYFEDMESVHGAEAIKAEILDDFQREKNLSSIVELVPVAGIPHDDLFAVDYPYVSTGAETILKLRYGFSVDDVSKCRPWPRTIEIGEKELKDGRWADNKTSRKVMEEVNHLSSQGNKLDTLTLAQCEALMALKDGRYASGIRLLRAAGLEGMASYLEEEFPAAVAEAIINRENENRYAKSEDSAALMRCTR